MTLLTVGATAACGSATAQRAGGAASYAKDYHPGGSAVIASGQTLPIELGDMYFRPNSLTAISGAALRLSLHNGSPITHNFTLAALGISQNVSPGRTVIVAFTAPPTGTYPFDCEVPGHAAAGMVGHLVVR